MFDAFILGTSASQFSYKYSYRRGRGLGSHYLFDEQYVHGTYHATYTNKWTESLPYPAHLPGNTREPSVLASILWIAVVEDIGAQTAEVRHAADKKQHDDQHGGEVEQRTHSSGDNENCSSHLTHFILSTE
jgi:hypothetical protein